VLVVALLSSVLPACSRLVPKETTQVEVQEKVLVTFNNGDQLRGRVDLDEWVDVTVGGVVHRGRIVDLNQDEIMIGDAIPVKILGDHRYEAGRMVDAKIKPTPTASSYVFQRGDISEVHMVALDGAKTARRMAFWTSVGISLMLLFLERS
jgi:hypothetical protein